MNKFFEQLRERKDLFTLRGSTIIVEIIDEELKTESGIILQTDKNQAIGGVDSNKLHVGKVLMTGPGYEDEDGEIEPLEVGPGAMVLLPKYGLSFVSMFPGLNEPTGEKLALVKFDQILAYYPSEEAYGQAKKFNN